MDHGRKPYGDLAKSWDVSDDGLTYTFHLHDNVYWHDGVKFSSADVKFTYDTAIEKKYPISRYLKLVKEIIAPDDNTIVFKLSEFNAAFLHMFGQASNWYGQIIAKHLYEGTDIPNNPQNKKPVGTGAFKIVEWKPGQFISVKANEKWFHGRAYLDKIIWRLYTNKEVAQADFRSGNIDLLQWTLTPQAFETKALAAMPGVRLWKQVGPYTYDFLYNHTRKPMSDVRVREAVALAIDRDEVSNLAWGGLLAPNYKASSPGTPEFTNNDVRWPEKNLQRARQLLDEAGYSAGASGLRMQITAPSTEEFKGMTEVVVQQLKKIGIEVKIELMDSAAWWSVLRSGKFDIVGYWVRYGPDPDAYREHFGTGGVRNFGKYSNASLDDLVQGGTKVRDVTKRKQIYDKVQEILRKNFSYLPVIQLDYFGLSKSSVHGNPIGDPATYGKTYGWAGYSRLWLER